MPAGKKREKTIDLERRLAYNKNTKKGGSWYEIYGAIHKLLLLLHVKAFLLRVGADPAVKITCRRDLFVYIKVFGGG